MQKLQAWILLHTKAGPGACQPVVWARGPGHSPRCTVVRKFLFAWTNTPAQIQFLHSSRIPFGVAAHSVIFGTFVGGANPFSHERLGTVLSGSDILLFFSLHIKGVHFSSLRMAANSEEIQKYNNLVCFNSAMKRNLGIL